MYVPSSLSLSLSLAYLFFHQQNYCGTLSCQGMLSQSYNAEFEEIKRTATVKQLHLFCFDEAFTHQVEYIYFFDSHTVELKCVSLPLSLSLAYPFFHQQHYCGTLSC